MCAIYGMVNYHSGINSEIAQQFLNFCSSNLSHRGPDGFDAHIGHNNAFGHSRLSIIDLSSSSTQPKIDSNSIMTYNGEIYNYKEIAEDLSDVELPLNSSDTLALFYFLKKFSVSYLDKLNGMFAFAFANKENSYLVRDRFGVKPLYYAWVGDTLFFSSEINILRDYFKLNRLDEVEYSELREKNICDHNSKTIYKGIFQIPAGSYLTINKYSVTISKWYTPKARCSATTEEKFEDNLVAAIERRMVADVPICISLSGGLDSSTLYCLSNERLGVTLPAFTCTHETHKTNEFERASYLSSYYSGELTAVPSKVSEINSIKDFEASILATEYPIWGVSSLDYDNLYHAMHHSGYRVVIEGHGADEVLSGYGFMLRQAIVDAIRSGEIGLSIKLVHNLIAVEPNLLKKNALTLTKFWLGCLLSGFKLRGDTRSSSKVRIDAIVSDILPSILRCFDRLSMKNSLESRAPFLDYKVVEQGLGMNGEQLLTNLGNKSILRKILNKYGHFNITENTQKLGFASDLELLLKNVRFWNSIKEDSFFIKNYERFPYINKALNLKNYHLNSEKDIYEIFREIGFLIFEKNLYDEN